MTTDRMHLVSALFVENFEMRQAPGPSTRLDITGAMFSLVAPSPPPFTLSPHLVALIYCPPQVSGNGVFEVIFTNALEEPDAAGEHLARNVSPFSVEQGKFTYRLVKAELDFPDYSQVFAWCRIGKGPWHVVPLTLLPPPG